MQNPITEVDTLTVDTNVDTIDNTFEHASLFGTEYRHQEHPEDVFSVRIDCERKTYFFDIKKGMNYFVKLTEKFKGRKATVVIDKDEFSRCMDAMRQIEAKLAELSK
jgi:hypothetical protein